jgi:hypothetical protein
MMISMAVEAAVAGITTEDMAAEDMAAVIMTVVIVTDRCAAWLDRRLNKWTDLL